MTGPAAGPADVRRVRLRATGSGAIGGVEEPCPDNVWELRTRRTFPGDVDMRLCSAGGEAVRNAIVFTSELDEDAEADGMT